MILAKMVYKLHQKQRVEVSLLQNTRNRFNQKSKNSYKSFKSWAISSHLIHTATCSTTSNLAKKEKERSMHVNIYLGNDIPRDQISDLKPYGISASSSGHM